MGGLVAELVLTTQSLPWWTCDWSAPGPRVETWVERPSDTPPTTQASDCRRSCLNRQKANQDGITEQQTPQRAK